MTIKFYLYKKVRQTQKGPTSLDGLCLIPSEASKVRVTPLTTML